MQGGLDDEKVLGEKYQFNPCPPGPCWIFNKDSDAKTAECSLNPKYPSYKCHRLKCTSEGFNIEFTQELLDIGPKDIDKFNMSKECLPQWIGGKVIYN